MRPWTGNASGRARLGLAVLLFAAALAAFPEIVSGQSQPPAKPSPRDKCPVCGMFVAGYPDFLAAVTFKDGAVFYFDGPKDMFRFLFEPGKYSPGRDKADIGSIWVTDYYSLALVDGSAAFFIRGSDILGPMGAELIPFAKEGEAKEFLNDHKGEALLLFKDVTREVIAGLD
jgi:nitrous oxide reductase accessory protein NosL